MMEAMEGFQKCEMWSKQTKIYISVLKMLSFVVESQQPLARISTLEKHNMDYMKDWTVLSDHKYIYYCRPHHKLQLVIT